MMNWPGLDRWSLRYAALRSTAANLTNNDDSNVMQSMLMAACHCGAVHLEVDKKPESLTECTCSICHRLGAQWAHYTRGQVRITGSADARVAYMWGDRCIEFYHCKICGCTTHYESVEKEKDSRVSINTRMMRREDTSGIPVRKFDGADTWGFIEE
ncbi:MAG: hypothetical protein WBS20_16005 [Lysobacterales bacterium]